MQAQDLRARWVDIFQIEPHPGRLPPSALFLDSLSQALTRSRIAALLFSLECRERDLLFSATRKPLETGCKEILSDL